MAGYYDPNVGWVEFTDAEAASLPQTQNLPWMPTQNAFYADPFGGGGLFFPSSTPEGPRADPTQYFQTENSNYYFAPDADWSLGLGRWGENLQGVSFKNTLQQYADQLGWKPTDMQWAKAINPEYIVGRGISEGLGNWQVSPNTSNETLERYALQNLAEQNGWDQTGLNQLLSSPSWQSYAQSAPTMAGQRQTQYNAMSKNPMPWPVSLIAAATGGLMGYGALSGMGALGGGGIGGSSASGLAAADVAGGLIPEFGSIGAYDAAIGAGSSLGAGGTGAFTVPTSGLGGSEFGLLNASGASDMSFFPDILGGDWWNMAPQDFATDVLGQTNLLDWNVPIANSMVPTEAFATGYPSWDMIANGLMTNLGNSAGTLPAAGVGGGSSGSIPWSSVGNALKSLLLGSQGSAAYDKNGLLGLLGGSNGLLGGNNGLLGGAVSLSPIWYGYDKGKDIIGDGFDTSRQESLYNQFNPQAGTLEYDLNTGRGRETLNAGLQRRGVTGSSFANFDNASYNTLRELGRQDLINRNVGIAGSLANSITNTDVLKAQMQMDLLGRALGASGWALGGRSLLG